MKTNEIYLLDRNNYTLKKYVEVSEVDLTPTETGIAEALASRSVVQLSQMKHYVERRRGKPITVKSLAQHMHRMREKGIYMYATNHSEYIMENDIWVK